MNTLLGHIIIAIIISIDYLIRNHYECSVCISSSRRVFYIIISIGNGFKYRIEYSNILIFNSFK